MKNRRWLAAVSRTSTSAFAFLLVSLSVSSTVAGAQTIPAQPNGETAIYESASGAINSQAYVDASVFYPTQGDICGVINYILVTDFSCGGSTNPKGVIIDARGINPPTGSTLQCNTQPFAPKCSSPPNSPIDGNKLSSTILLPAATIEIQQTWTIPANTKVIGEGKNLTTLQACTATTQGCTGAFSGDMIDLGNSACSAGNCFGLGIEHLTLDGNSQSVNGIVNPDLSDELSYVNDVALLNIGGTGLLVQGGSGNPGGNNSGPYSNIYFSGPGTCAKINGTRSTRGIHGLTCVATNPSSGPLILIDGSNNSIEDVALTFSRRPVGPDGILIGSQASAQGNVLVNITGNNLAKVIHISSNASDLTVLGVANSGSSTTIRDDLTSTTLTDATVGMYVVGEPVFGQNLPVGYSRFTTSPSAPAWFVGSGAPTSGSCNTGSMYSDNTGTAGATLWACVGGGAGWKKVK